MKKAVYPGSFDPVTNGHLDIIQRAAQVFDEIKVVVMINPEKRGLFNIEERVQMIENAIGDLQNVEIECFEGLLINYMKEKEINVIVKGLRGVSDFEYEIQMAHMNNKLDSSIETVFMMTSAQYSYISSSAVKQVAKFGGSLKGLVPEEVAEKLVSRMGSI